MRDRGFSVLEILVAILLVAVVMVASLQLTVAVMGILGRSPAAFARPADEKAARLRSLAATWGQAELEFVKQVGYEPVCPSDDVCTFWAPRADCTGSFSSLPFQDVGPALPQDFAAVRLQIRWDPTSPVLDGERQLRLVRLDLYREAADCLAGLPFLTLYTGLRKK